MTGELEILYWIQRWYLSQCHSRWEHAYGITIQTLDNPGWKVIVDLTDTPVEGLLMDPEIIERETEDDWVSYAIEDRQFAGYGGPENLVEILSKFRELVNGSGTAER